MVKLPAHCYVIFLCPLGVGPNLAVFVPKILIFMGESKIFGTHTTKKTPRHIVCIFLVGHWITWAKNADIWPKMSVLDQIWPFLGQKSIYSEGGWSKTFDSLISGKQ